MAPEDHLFSEFWTPDPDSRFRFMGLKIGDNYSKVREVLVEHKLLYRLSDKGDPKEIGFFFFTEDSMRFDLLIQKSMDNKIASFFFYAKACYSTEEVGFSSLTMARISSFLNDYPVATRVYKKKDKHHLYVEEYVLFGDDHVIKIKKHLEPGDSLLASRLDITFKIISEKEYAEEEKRFSRRMERFWELVKYELSL